MANTQTLIAESLRIGKEATAPQGYHDAWQQLQQGVEQMQAAYQRAGQHDAVGALGWCLSYMRLLDTLGRHNGTTGEDGQ